MREIQKKSVIFELPFTYPSWNRIQNMHPIVRGKEKKKFMNDVGVILSIHKIEPFRKKVNLTIDVCFSKVRRRDNDNYGGKWLIDALCRAGIIPDDSTDWIPHAPDIMVVSGKKEQNKTLVKIEEI